jgi:hypothetical protein
MQATIDGLKVKLRSLQNRLDDDERYKENLRKTINRLVTEKRSLEEKLKFKGKHKVSMIQSPATFYLHIFPHVAPANDNERMHRLIEENTQWRNRFEILEHRLREMSDDESSTDRHRLQISVLQDRLKKQEEQIAQLESQVTHPSTRHAAKAAIEQLHRENVALKILSQRVLVVGPKMIENIQRLDKYERHHLQWNMYRYIVLIFISVWSTWMSDLAIVAVKDASPFRYNKTDLVRLA